MLTTAPNSTNTSFIKLHLKIKSIDMKTVLSCFSLNIQINNNQQVVKCRDWELHNDRVTVHSYLYVTLTYIHCASFCVLTGFPMHSCL